MSLATRAIAAGVLLVGFYSLAIALLAFLVWIPAYLLFSFGRFNLYLTIGCFGGAWAILKGLAPQRDRFEPPGVPLEREKEGALFRTLDEVAVRTGQPAPAEVYLIPEFNAWVAQRGGMFGVGGRRVMALGLPLMQSLSVAEFKAVLAHEFGHFAGGETALGPWVYHTRAGILRTAIALEERGSLVVYPFVWYNKLFLRLTQAISRSQEYAADALAARVAGKRAMPSALSKLDVGGAASHVYFAS